MSGASNKAVLLKVLVTVFVPCALMCIALFASLNLLELFEKELEQRGLDKALISRANTLAKLFHDSAVAVAGYNVTQSPTFSDRLQRIENFIPTDLEDFSRSRTQTVEQEGLKSQIQTSAESGLKEVRGTIAFIKAKQADPGFVQRQHQYKEIRTLADQISELTREFAKESRADSFAPARAILKLATVSSSVGAYLLGLILLILLSFHIAKLKSSDAISGSTLASVLKGIVVVFAPLLPLTFGLTAMLESIFAIDGQIQNQNRKTDLLVHANELSNLFYDAGVHVGGYSITKSKLFIDAYEATIAEIPNEISELRRIAANNAKELEQIDKIEQVQSVGIKILNEAREAIDDNRVDVAQFRAKHMYKDIRTFADKMQDSLRELTADARTASQLGRQSASQKCIPFLIGLVSASVLLGLILSFFYARSFSKKVVEK